MAAFGRLIMDTAKLAFTAIPGVSGPRPPRAFEYPTPHEVLEVKDILLKSFNIHLELVDMIIDFAEYWPCNSVSTARPTVAVGGHKNPREDTFILRTLPLGFFPGGTGKGPPRPPLDSYVLENNVAHKIETSDAVEAETSDLLNKWKGQSLPRTRYPCRKVVFTIVSKDQGWVDRREFRGTYEGSYTWFDVGLERIKAIDGNMCSPEILIPQGFTEQFSLPSGDKKGAASMFYDLQTIQPQVIGRDSRHTFEIPNAPTDQRLQSNRTGIRELKEHIITWAYDDCIDPFSADGDRLEKEGRGRKTGNGKFVRNLQVGDTITVWARARFPGWINDLKEIKVDIYWAV